MIRWVRVGVLEEKPAGMCKRGPKLTVVCHIPNHPTTFGRNFECEIIFASFLGWTEKTFSLVLISYYIGSVPNVHCNNPAKLYYLLTTP